MSFLKQDIVERFSGPCSNLMWQDSLNCVTSEFGVNESVLVNSSPHPLQPKLRGSHGQQPLTLPPALQPLSRPVVSFKCVDNHYLIQSTQPCEEGVRSISNNSIPCGSKPKDKSLEPVFTCDHVQPERMRR